MKKILFFSLALSLSSCYSVYGVYTGNVHDQLRNKSKNEVLRAYGVADKVEEDGAGGQILIYEKLTQTTTSANQSSMYGGTNSAGAAAYGNGAAYGIAQSRSAANSNSYGVTNTTVNKTFVNVFLNKEGIVYDYKSNYGNQYKYEKCFDKTKTWVGVVYSGLFVFPLPITIPLAIVKQRQAKKKGQICK